MVSTQQASRSTSPEQWHLVPVDASPVLGCQHPDKATAGLPRAAQYLNFLRLLSHLSHLSLSLSFSLSQVLGSLQSSAIKYHALPTVENKGELNSMFTIPCKNKLSVTFPITFSLSLDFFLCVSLEPKLLLLFSFMVRGS